MDVLTRQFKCTEFTTLCISKCNSKQRKNVLYIDIVALNTALIGTHDCFHSTTVTTILCMFGSEQGMHLSHDSDSAVSAVHDQYVRITNNSQ